MPTFPRPARRTTALLIACTLIAGVLQLPIAWSCARLGAATTPPWSHAFVTRPASIESDTEIILLGRISHMGVCAVSAEAWPPTPLNSVGAHTEQPGSPVVTEMCAPWQPDQLHPALLDSSAWPTHTGVYSRPNLIHSEPLAFRVASGWPFLCVEGRIEYTSSREYTYIGILTDPRFLPPPTSETAYLCYLPRWPALIANSLIHGALLATLAILGAATVRGLVARSRRKRGRCTICAYDLSHSAPQHPCPECGTRRDAPAPPAIDPS
jgi:hypothetical protein